MQANDRQAIPVSLRPHGKRRYIYRLPDQKLRNWAQFLVKLAISVIVLWLAVRQIDLHGFTGDLHGVHPIWLLMALMQLLFIPPLGGARWWVVLNASGDAPGVARLTRLFWIGMVFNQILPSASGGDAVRILLAWRAGIPMARSIHSVVLERIALLLTLSGMVAAFQPILLSRTSLPGTRLLPPLIFSGAIGGLALIMYADRVVDRLPTWPPLMKLSAFSVDARKTFMSRSGLQLIALCILTNLNLSLVSLWLGKALDIPLNFLDYIVFIPIVTLITTIPVSIGGWGIREGATVLLFGSLGVISHTALAFSILFGLSIAVISIPGLPFLWLNDRTLQHAPPAGQGYE